jgi:YesN/AraC family two-component response regulator
MVGIFPTPQMLAHQPTEERQGVGLPEWILRVLVVDDSETVRRGLRRLLQTQVDIHVVGEAVDGVDAIRKTQIYKPDVVLMDAAMPTMNGFEAARHIMGELPSTLILMVSQFDSDAFAREALAAGAVGYILKSNASKQLIPALTEIRGSG